MNKNMIKAGELRKNLDSLPESVGIYRWYANKETCEEIFSSFKDWEKIFADDPVHMIDGKECYLIYLGTSSRKNAGIRKRLSWHITQEHDLNSVKTGTLSTFRQTLSSLVANDQSDTDATNNIIDKLWVEYETLDLPCGEKETIDFIEQKEETLIDKYHPPLNIKSNNPKSETKKAFKKFLTKRRKESKEIALQKLESLK